MIIAAAASGMLSGSFTIDADYSQLREKSGTRKIYDNKNANVEYYTDEHGNIRRRKK